MKTTHKLGLLAGAILLPALQANAAIITFENLAVGTILSNQYAGLGATFSANAFSGAGGPTGPWATNTDMTIVSSAGTDVGGLGTPAGVVSGNILRSFDGWLNENGDPSFTINFSTSINAFSAAFAGVSTAADVKLFAYNGATLLGTVSGVTSGQFVLSFNAPTITRIVVTPGSFSDWVGVDNINFTPNAVGAIPEPATWGMMLLGFGAMGVAIRRAKQVAVTYA